MANFTHKLAYQFHQPALLKQALRHRSAGKPNNERLEFLGDAVLGFIISELLYRKFPSATEGELSRWRSQLVQRPTLAALARELGIGDSLELGQGELKSGGAERESILADAVEALISALLLDGGLELCHSKVEQWFLPRLAELQNGEVPKDPKTRLQELLQARKRIVPTYTVTAVTGSGHQQIFTVECRTTLSNEVFIASASTRKEAEQIAATMALAQLERGK